MDICKILLEEHGDEVFDVVGGGNIKLKDAEICAKNRISIMAVYFPVRSDDEIPPDCNLARLPPGSATVMIDAWPFENIYAILNIQVMRDVHREFTYLTPIDDLIKAVRETFSGSSYQYCKDNGVFVSTMAFVSDWEEVVPDTALLLSSKVADKPRPGALAKIMRMLWESEVIENLAEALSSNHNVDVEIVKSMRVGNTIAVSIGAREERGIHYVRYSIPLDTERKRKAYLFVPVDDIS